MTIILANNLLTMQFPQTRIMIRTSRDQVCRIRTESTIPDPALMTSQSTLQLEWLRVFLRSWCLAWDWQHALEVLDFPNLGCVVCRAGCEVFDIGGEKDSGYVVLMGVKVGNRDEGSFFAVLEEMPNIDIALYELSAGVQRHDVVQTELVPAQRVEPSLATVTLATGTSSSGMS